MQRSKMRLRASIAILVAAFASFVLSVSLWFSGRQDMGLFVGLWVPSILSFGSVALLMGGGRND
jgi:hypothetical protein